MSEYDHSTSALSLAFETYTVRVHFDAQGQPWWVAQDVCQILGILEAKDTLRYFPSDERGACSTPTPGGLQSLLTVNEPGLYRLIFQSRKPEAEAFKRWVFHEVLPTLRRSGQFVTPGRSNRRVLDGPKELTVRLLLCFWAVYTTPTAWYTTSTLARACGVSVRRVRDYCAYFAAQGLFERIHTHPQKLYRWNPQAIVVNAGLVDTFMKARQALPDGMPDLSKPIWETESDPRNW